MNLGAGADKRKVETIAVKCCYHCRFRRSDVGEEAVEDAHLRKCDHQWVAGRAKEKLTDLICFVEDGKRSFVPRSWGVLEILDVLADNFAIRDQESLTVYHV